MTDSKIEPIATQSSPIEKTKLSPTTFIAGVRANWAVSDRGQIMGTDTALASIEPEGIYEHLAVGALEEGYTLAYKINGVDNIKYDVYQSSQGINPTVDSGFFKNENDEFVKHTLNSTDDNAIGIRQVFTIAKNGTRILIRMDITNRSKFDLDDFLVKRYADLDVDTGGSAGWAGFLARWDKNRDSVFTYNLDSDAPQGKRGHVVNMVALPSDLPLDGTFVGLMGAQQYAFRDNPALLSPLPTQRVDGSGVLQWRTSKFRSGEMVSIHMYYDTFRAFAR